MTSSLTSSSNDESSSSFTTALQNASQSWSQFAIETKQRPLLSNVITQSKANNQQSLSTRKSLADTTKAFKKLVKQLESIFKNSQNNNNNDKALFETFTNQCKTLVKSYQEEIDNLTKRCKSYDSLLNDMHRDFNIQNLSDPALLFTKCIEYIMSLEGQVHHLLKGMEEIQNEMTRQDNVAKEDIHSLEMELKETKEEMKKVMKELDTLKKNNQSSSSSEQDDTSNNKNNIKGGGGVNNHYMSKEEKEELINLRKEVAEYELEFKDLKNQDITIKKLNAKIEDLMMNQEEELQKELKKAQEHLAQTEGRRATEALEREAAMARKLASLELELKAERAGSQAAQTHLLEADQGQNEREAVWEAQRQILVDDSDRLREVLHEVTRERDSLKMRVEALTRSYDDDDDNEDGMGSVGDGVSSFSISGKRGKNGNGGTNSMVDIAAERQAYEAEVGELTLTVTTMRDELRAKEETMFKLQSSMQATIESLESERGYLANKVLQLESEIAVAPSKEMIDNMRRELRILKNLEYNAIDIETEKEEPELTSTISKDLDDDLESVLIGKLRKIEADLVKERREKSDHLEECQKLKEQMSSLLQAKTDADNLITRLELDLEKAITVPSANSEKTKSMDNDLPMNVTSDPSTLQHILDPSSTPAPVPSSPIMPQSNSAVEKMNDDHSVATIIMAQRDRLRARCEGLEAERDSFKRELQVQVASAESLKADNTKLYEKVRYLQNYNNSSSIQIHSRDNARGSGDRDLDLEALEQRYEASVDPFRQFSRNERQRKLNEMSPVEKTVFVVARTVLGSKETRTALFFYVCILHLLVFATTYHWSHGCHTVPFQHHSALDELHAGVPNLEGS